MDCASCERPVSAGMGNVSILLGVWFCHSCLRDADKMAAFRRRYGLDGDAKSIVRRGARLQAFLKESAG